MGGLSQELMFPSASFEVRKQTARQPLSSSWLPPWTAGMGWDGGSNDPHLPMGSLPKNINSLCEQILGNLDNLGVLCKVFETCSPNTVQISSSVPYCAFCGVRISPFEKDAPPKTGAHPPVVPARASQGHPPQGTIPASPTLLPGTDFGKSGL